jgi:hypothetical protein
MAGSEMNQNRKKHRRSFDVVPVDSGIWFAISASQVLPSRYGRENGARRLLMLGHIDLSMTSIHWPPTTVCTPYQILASGR